MDLRLNLQPVFVISSLFGGTLISASHADPFFFSTGDPDGRIATASLPASTGKFEIETADDFVLSQPVSLSSATFTGLLPSGISLSAVSDVTVGIYRVFPNDSDTARTSGSPTFSTPQVPTRVNSPSDVELLDRVASGGTLTFSPAVLSSSFTAANSVVNGINPKPANVTGGEGSVTGEEVRFSVQFSTPVDLAAGHYFFVPQVELSDSNAGDFLWLSAAKPITSPGTPFPPGSTDLQTWIRNANIDPDWLRVGTDIVGGAPAPTFNAVFSLSGETVPDGGSTIGLFAIATGAFSAFVRRKQRPSTTA